MKLLSSPFGFSLYYRRNMSMLKTIGQSISSRGLDKPGYKVTGSGAGYEERQYEASKWVSTKVLGMELDVARSKGFGRLFKYIGGENDKGVKVAMTAPVATRIVPGAGPNCENEFTVSFYIPPNHQEAPPVPINADVYVDSFPEMTVYANGFGGFAKEEQFINEARTLGENLEGKKFDQDSYFVASYDSPYKLFNRLNEVWFVKQE